MEEEDEYLVFIGNPGTGKSTILNGLVGKPVFPNGISIARGLTAKSKIMRSNGIHYVDTPGLFDIDTRGRRQAIEEIESVLKLNKRYKIFFICSLEEGRVRLGDILIIKFVLESISIQIHYGIVINKVTDEILNVSEKEIRYLFTCLNLYHEPTIFFYFQKEKKEWQGHKESFSPKLDPKLVTFLQNVPSTYISSDQVSMNKTKEAFQEQKIQELEKLIAELKNNEKKMKRIYEEQINELRKTKSNNWNNILEILKEISPIIAPLLPQLLPLLISGQATPHSCSSN